MFGVFGVPLQRMLPLRDRCRLRERVQACLRAAPSRMPGPTARRPLRLSWSLLPGHCGCLVAAARPRAPPPSEASPFTFGINLPCINLPCMNGSSGTGAFSARGLQLFVLPRCDLRGPQGFRQLGFTAIRIMVNIETAGHPAALAAHTAISDGIWGHAIVCLFGTGSTVTHGTGRSDSMPEAIAAWSAVHAVFGAMPGFMDEIFNEPHGYGDGFNVAPCGTLAGYLEDIRAIITGAGLPEDRVQLPSTSFRLGQFSRGASALCHPTRAVGCTLRRVRADWMLIDACNPMLCPNWGFRSSSTRSGGPRVFRAWAWVA